MRGRAKPQSQAARQAGLYDSLAVGLALLVAASVRTTMQATIAGGAISLILAALGGIMVPKLVMPPAMQHLTLVSPMAW